MIFRKE